MQQGRTLSTDGLPPGQRLDYWMGVATEPLMPHEVEPFDAGRFFGHLTRFDLGDARLVEIRADAHTVTRSRHHVSRTDDTQCLLYLQIEGEMTSVEEGQETTLHPGDIAIYDIARPRQIHFAKPTRLLALRIPRQMLAPHVGNLDAIASRPLPGATGPGALAGNYLRELWSRSHELDSLGVAPRYVDILLQLVAGAYAAFPQARVDQSGAAMAHRIHAVQYVERALKNPNLTPTSIADALRITPAHLHRVFSGEPESVGRRILRRRLEECRKILLDPMQREKSITSVAFEYGFNSSAHFSRAFRDHFGISPRDVRN